jgi:Flp pilus assembly protein TadB
MGLFKRFFKPLVDVPRWIDYQNIKRNTASIFRYAKALVTPQQATRKETFQQAVQRLGLNEADLQRQMKTFYRLSWIYAFIAVSVFAYAVWMVINFSWIAAFVATVLGALSLGYAFRNRFWYFQIKTRRLGYGLKEWWQQDIRGQSHVE